VKYTTHSRVLQREQRILWLSQYPLFTSTSIGDDTIVFDYSIESTRFILALPMGCRLCFAFVKLWWHLYIRQNAYFKKRKTFGFKPKLYIK